jgi:hypothetical protein
VTELPVFRCHGAPRDLGLDQGLAAQEEIQAEARRVRPEGWLPRHLFEARPGPRTTRLARDTWRYFPHLAERMTGLGRGARVGPSTLAALLSRTLEGGDGIGLAASSASTGTGALVGRSIRLGVENASPGLWVRHSAPEYDFPSVEIGLAWRVPALIGVNAPGLAVTVSAEAADAASLEGCGAPAALLAQDCLQRFDNVENAVEWVERRPAGGRFSILMADASGSAVGILVEGQKRTLLDDAGGAVIGLGSPTERSTLEKACQSGGGLDLAAVARALAAASPGAALRVVADPAGRRLGVLQPGADVRWHSVEPASA